MERWPSSPDFRKAHLATSGQKHTVKSSKFTADSLDPIKFLGATTKDRQQETKTLQMTDRAEHKQSLEHKIPLQDQPLPADKSQDHRIK